ncbi:DUF2599 domain-containing protein [Dietzia sp. UBA5065]|uniref:DUF2599 domain-containing protein n=1 Tax=Dietzia sp. UBA5065 TaxID=1946422 RepID=UPI0025BEBA44|nr:DUF2599 domain-containing protein [Dietzia sp. UBA5065]HMT50863.1 DUF2599 domain-containing protein [Dietzia sp.]
MSPHRSRPSTAGAAVAVAAVAVATAAAAAGCAATSPPAPAPTPYQRPSTTPPLPAPARLIASATWAESDFGPSLEVVPTADGRGNPGVSGAALAWREVLDLAPDAGTPGMREQFDCHWTWARVLEPDKPTWNLEPWRPPVGADLMAAEGCNPGGPEV